MYKYKKIDLVPKAGQRVLVISDIHGNLKHLEELLKKANFCKDDLLIVVGDMLEKGPDSLNTLRYMMKLCDEGRAVVAMGNVDYWMLEMAVDTYNNPKIAADLMGYMKRLRDWKGTCFYDEMFRETGDLPENEEELVAAIGKAIKHFSAEFEFLKSLPTVIETEKYIFVHGGLRHGDDEFDKTPDEEKNALDYMKYDIFMTKAREDGRKFGRYIVCGHWPTPNYCEKTLCANPIFDDETRIISIDGGCGLIHEGQLNALIFPSLDCDKNEIEFVAYDGIATAIALDAQEESEDYFSIGWLNNDVRVINRDGDMAEIEQIVSGRRMWTHESILWYPDAAETKVRQCTDYLLPVSVGDEIAIIRETSRGILAKKNGTVGWYGGRVKNI